MDEVSKTETCSKCRKIKPIFEFHKNRRRATGHSNNCKMCQNKFTRIHHINNEDDYKETRNRHRRKRMDIIIKIKSDAGCKICGEKHPACLDFHHRNKAEKLFGIAQSISGLFKIDAIMIEIAKCDVMCSNCHRKEHWDDFTKSWKFTNTEK